MTQPVATLRATDAQTPYYRPQRNEVELFGYAWHNQLPVLLKGPTGCGKTRFIEHMAARLGRPLYTVACHDDLTATDLVGRHLLGAGATYWHDGPLTRAVREGAICYLDEIVEARKDTTVVLHPLSDDRRMLPIERTGELLQAPPEFMLVVSYNPGYQHMLKGMKPSRGNASSRCALTSRPRCWRPKSWSRKPASRPRSHSSWSGLPMICVPSGITTWRNPPRLAC